VRERRVGLYLNQHIGVNECADLDYRRGRRMLSKEFSVRQAKLFPAGDAGETALT